MLKTDAIAVNLQHDGTLQKGNGQHEAQALFEAQDNSLNAR